MVNISGRIRRRNSVGRFRESNEKGTKSGCVERTKKRRKGGAVDGGGKGEAIRNLVKSGEVEDIQRKGPDPRSHRWWVFALSRVRTNGKLVRCGWPPAERRLNPARYRPVFAD